MHSTIYQTCVQVFSEIEILLKKYLLKYVSLRWNEFPNYNHNTEKIILVCCIRNPLHLENYVLNQRSCGCGYSLNFLCLNFKNSYLKQQDNSWSFGDVFFHSFVYIWRTISLFQRSFLFLRKISFFLTLPLLGVSFWSWETRKIGSENLRRERGKKLKKLKHGVPMTRVDDDDDDFVHERRMTVSSEDGGEHVAPFENYKKSKCGRWILK